MTIGARIQGPQTGSLNSVPMSAALITRARSYPALPRLSERGSQTTI
jgi:hypothetical protein